MVVVVSLWCWWLWVCVGVVVGLWCWWLWVCASGGLWLWVCCGYEFGNGFV